MDFSNLVPATQDGPTGNLVNPLLTDFYQITMSYTYWKAKRHEENAVFDMFFRKNPFNGEFTIFAGLEEVIRFVQSYKITQAQVDYLKSVLPGLDNEFWDYFSKLDCSSVKIYAIAEGTVVFPRLPLLRIEGPLVITQLLESTILNACNYASLIATNAARFRLAVGKTPTLLEFGLRRAQGPDGAMSASRYSYMGGFDGTSNVLAGMTFGINVMGTHAHSLVSAFTGFNDLNTPLLAKKGSTETINLVERALAYREKLGYTLASNGELIAFISYAQAFPDSFLALVDTYDTLSSGVPNYICVALSLIEVGYTPRGIRLDSGDLAYLSIASRDLMKQADAVAGTNLHQVSKIVASNDLNEAVLHSLEDQAHSIDIFGIGTNLVTCQAQPALGMVYKLVEIDGTPRIKLSQDIAKVTIPAAKEVYRLFGVEGIPILDLIIRQGEMPPASGRRVLCRHPFDEKKRAFVTPSVVLPLLRLCWVGKNAVFTPEETSQVEFHSPRAHSYRHNFPSLSTLRDFVFLQLDLFRKDHLRPLNPTPYKISVSPELYHFIHDLWMKEIPVTELS
jgi:nicotinate phosphoribosyltransferase